jgi:CubicO group peptidase (beta-lactamase class C family)
MLTGTRPGWIGCTSVSPQKSCIFWKSALNLSWVFGPRPDWLYHVAYRWDAVTKTGKFFKGGFGGQILFIAPQKDVVIVHFGTNKSLDDTGPLLSLGDMVDDLF